MRASWRRCLITSRLHFSPSHLSRHLPPSLPLLTQRPAHSYPHSHAHLHARLSEILQSPAYEPYLQDWLRFVTGSSVITSETHITVQLQDLKNFKASPEDFIPQSQTCFMTLMLPDRPYPGKEHLFSKLVICAQHAMGFGSS